MSESNIWVPYGVEEFGGKHKAVFKFCVLDIPTAYMQLKYTDSEKKEHGLDNLAQRHMDVTKEKFEKDFPGWLVYYPTVAYVFKKREAL